MSEQRGKQIHAEIEAAAQTMIEGGFVVETVENGERIWTLTEAGRDCLAVLREHRE